MLFFIYSGKIVNLEKNAIELLKASDVYQIDNLKGIFNTSEYSLI
jgi:hypothetical protein